MIFKFVYAGRLDQEKGIEDIVFAVRKILEEQQFDIQVDIFGQYGNCGKVVEDLVLEFPMHIHYHGRQPKATIIPYWKASYALLMPSHFLETFGLTCLDSYAFGKPVIGYQKGGLRELVLDEYAISSDVSLSSGEALYQKILSCMQQFDPGHYDAQSKQCLDIFQKHSKEQWKRHFTKICKDLEITTTPRVLILSDYLSRLGGIETFLYEAKYVLESMGCFLSLQGSYFSSLRGRIFGLLATTCNLWEGGKLIYSLQQKSYDILRFHSIQRYLGWFPLWLASFSRAKKLFMLHDVGLLHPYPHLVTSEEQLVFDWNIASYLKAGYSVGKVGYFAAIAMVLKYCSTRIVRRSLLKSIDIYLVPSSYLLPHLQRFLGGQRNIIVLPHFVDINNV